MMEWLIGEFRTRNHVLWTKLDR